MRRQFTLRRLLLGIMAFAVVLGLTGKLQGGSMAGALVASTAIAGLVVLAKRSDTAFILSAVLFSGVGALSAAAATPVIDPGGCTLTQSFYAVIGGAIGGWLVGCVAIRIDSWVFPWLRAEDHSEGEP